MLSPQGGNRKKKGADLLIAANKKRISAIILCLALAAVFLMGAVAGRVSLDGRETYSNAAEAVFYIRALNEEGKLKTSGSGFAVTKSGISITAAHVVKGAAAVHAVMPSGEEVALEVLEVNNLTDIAVVKLPAKSGGYRYIPLEKDSAEYGERAYAIGYPLKTAKIISYGIVSSPGAVINGVDRLLVSVDLASGMSGGPVICERGTVIGMSSATLRTMNGVSASPTTAQLRAAVDRYTLGSK